MIHMPRRSVTRFFIPLIDVLLLLFCIFLLMPFVSEEESESRASPAKLEEQAEQIQRLERNIKRLKDQLDAYRNLRDRLDQLKELQERVDALTRAKLQKLDEGTRQIYIDGKSGELIYYDATAVDPKQRYFKIGDDKAARTLIAKLQQEGKEQELFYRFIFPLKSPHPRDEDLKQYLKWFAGVHHNLQRVVQ